MNKTIDIMSKGTAFFAFVAGIATGVTLTMLSFTEKGQRIIEAVENKGEELFKDLGKEKDSDEEPDFEEEAEKEEEA